jgi:hypothetical protein
MFLETFPTPSSNPYLSSNSAPRENARVMPFFVGLMTAMMRRILKPRIP